MKKLIFMFLVMTTVIFADKNEDFLEAVENNKMVQAQLLLKLGADLEAKDQWFEKTPLMIAASKNNVEMLEFLVNKGAKLETKNKDGFTALLWAVWTNSNRAAEYLINKGAKLDSKTKSGDTVLHLAVLQNNTNLISLFTKNQ